MRYKDIRQITAKLSPIVAVEWQGIDILAKSSMFIN